MEHQANRTRELCGEKVAVKSLFWHTIKNYVTVRLDEEPRYFDDTPSVRSNLFYCTRCWVDIEDVVKRNRRSAAE